MLPNGWQGKGHKNRVGAVGVTETNNVFKGDYDDQNQPLRRDELS